MAVALQPDSLASEAPVIGPDVDRNMASVSA